MRPPGALSPLPNIPVRGRSNELFRNSTLPINIVSHGNSTDADIGTTTSPPNSAPNTDRNPPFMADEKLCTGAIDSEPTSDRSEKRTRLNRTSRRAHTRSISR